MAGRAQDRPPRWTEYVPLDEVLRAPRNPKNHNAQVIAASMARFGVVELPDVDERTGRLVAGHGRLEDWEHRRDADEDPPEGVQLDADGRWLVPVNRGWSSRSDADAEAYLIVSNKSTELGGWDDTELADVLTDLRDQGLLEYTGFDDGDIEKLATKAIEEEGPGDFPSFDSDTIETEHQCPACGYRWSGSSAAKGEAETVAGDPGPDADDGSGFGPLAQDR
jgi:hypothetical protein